MSVSQIEIIKLMDAVECQKGTANATKYSDSWNFRKCTGSASVLVVSTAGTLAITQQCSADNVTWYNPVDISNGALGVVKAAQATTTGSYIVYTPVLTEWARFKVVESTAKTYVTLILIERVEV